MPRKKKLTKKEEEPGNPYKEYPTVNLMAPSIQDDGKTFVVEFVNENNDAIELPCSQKLYKALEEDQLYTNYRVTFVLHQSVETGLVEFISTRPKDLYKAYEVEYEDNMKVPDKEIYKAPT